VLETVDAHFIHFGIALQLLAAEANASLVSPL
jgi:hypothetical protein